MSTITGQTKAWLTSDWLTVEQFSKMDGNEAVNFVSVYMNDMTDIGWRLIGDATVTIEMHSKEVITQAELAALQEQLRAARVEAQEKENYILDRISRLTALTFDDNVLEAE